MVWAEWMLNEWNENENEMLFLYDYNKMDNDDAVHLMHIQRWFLLRQLFCGKSLMSLQ